MAFRQRNFRKKFESADEGEGTEVEPAPQPPALSKKEKKEK
eukprot:CAMPEP_0177610034 /NCGR_PEP_ID=MMETSP0419_2-20121207/19510_1 /TAXON_ID=582737 /ORGANISM="Tetraselmis sp., Strain GSL018" /LENGTH=40 /DNA_ID= /DNA_START= /DNA_END= /DNA_ORIENTATION=